MKIQNGVNDVSTAHQALAEMAREVFCGEGCISLRYLLASDAHAAQQSRMPSYAQTRTGTGVVAGAFSTRHSTATLGENDNEIQPRHRGRPDRRCSPDGRR